MAAVRYTWMFRTAAVVLLLFGVFWLLDATLFDRFARWRLHLVGMGIVAIVLGVMLFRRMKAAIAVSALLAALLSISAAVAAPQMRGPGILLVATVAILSGLYAALATRELFDPGA